MIVRVLSLSLLILVGGVSLMMAFKGLSASRFLPFQEKASGASWGSLDPRLQAVLLSIIRINGVGFLVVGVQLLIAVASAVLMENGTIIRMSASMAFVFCLGLGWSNYRLERGTGSRTPWRGSVMAAVAVGVSMILSMVPAHAGMPSGSAIPEVSRSGERTAVPADTGPYAIPHATMIYYDITGSTAAELRAQLNAHGPRGYDGYRGDATTRWFIRWSWPGYGTGHCRLSDATVTYDIQVTFPRWDPPPGAPRELVAQWNEYARRLAEHEKGHVDFIVDHYHSVLEAIRGAMCGTAEGAAQAALVPLRQHDLDYDRSTNHGATQGARFP